MKRIFVLLLIAATMIGCKKKDDDLNINMTLNQSGSITVNVSDSTGAAIANLTVKLYQGSSSSAIDEKATDASGNVSFENVLEGNYYVYIKKVTIGGKIYTVNQAVQIISGKTKSVAINPQSYVGSLQITFNDNSSSPGVPIKDHSVALFRSDDYYNLGSNPAFTAILGIAFATGTTNSNGKVIFTGVPAGASVTYMIYNSTKRYTPSYTTYTLTKGDEYKTSVSINSSYWISL